MKTSDFYYDLPKELIAQAPLAERDSSRLLVLEKGTGELRHKHFRDLPDFLAPGDCLVLNDSKVLPARIYGQKASSGANIEFLLLENKGNKRWEVLVKPGRKAKIGTKILFGGGLLEAVVVDVLEDGNRIAEFTYEGNIYEVLDRIGQMPLPHYITRRLEDRGRYQTVYCKELGSAAAPTAGLHFTPELIRKLQGKGVKIAYLTLHVGLGTFRPVKVDDVEKHQMYSEHYSLSKKSAQIINSTKENKGRVVCVGTTSCRTIESVADSEGFVRPHSGQTDIFIYPGYKFKVTDAIITNFHLPESTLIMLVSAFCGFNNTMNAYKTAVAERYRFFSFGDSMLIM